MKQIVLVAILLLALIACKEGEKEIKKGEYTLKGNITIKDKDTIFEGPISYINKLGKVETIATYANDSLHGPYKNFFPDGSVEWETNYYYGLENGFARQFDSAGKIMAKNYNHFGRRLGSTYYYSAGNIYKYRFFTLEGAYVYWCDYINSDSMDESSRLLNYVTNYIQVYGEMKIELFIYLVNPPHKRITFKIFDVDTRTNDSTLVTEIPTFKSDDQFREIYLDILKPEHKYTVTGEAFYPKENITIRDILRAEEKELVLPGSR
jgi:hypothetical protein